jgi:hypothetical protein
MQLCVSEKLKMSVRALMACGPRCFRCKLVIPSGPAEGEFLVARMACTVMAGVKGGGMSWSNGRECSLRRILRSCCLCGSLHVSV